MEHESGLAAGRLAAARRCKGSGNVPARVLAPPAVQRGRPPRRPAGRAALLGRARGAGGDRRQRPRARHAALQAARRHHGVRLGRRAGTTSMRSTRRVPTSRSATATSSARCGSICPRGWRATGSSRPRGKRWTPARCAARRASGTRRCAVRRLGSYTWTTTPCSSPSSTPTGPSTGSRPACASSPRSRSRSSCWPSVRAMPNGAGAAMGPPAPPAVLFLPVLLMLVFREKYPRWWFDWNLELHAVLQQGLHVPGAHERPLPVDGRAPVGNLDFRIRDRR